jgi:membrane associated rhomboid family serine protease
MGLYDRDYVREEPRGLQIGGDWSAVTTIIVINVVIYLIDLLSSVSPHDPNFNIQFNGSLLQEYGSLQGDLFSHPWQAYQLLTYGWLHSTTSLVHLLFNMMTLYFFGSDAEERIFSKTRFWQFYLGSMVFSGLGWVIAQQAWFPHTANSLPASLVHCIGASGAIAAVFIYDVLRNPHRTILFSMIFPLPAWVVGMLTLSMDIVGVMGKGIFGNVAYAAHLAGAASGFLFYKTNWCLGDLVPLSWLQRHWKKVNGPRVRLHRPSADDDDDMPDWEEDLSSRVDEILAKISASGEASLTNEERKILQNASRQFRQRQGK